MPAVDPNLADTLDVLYSITREDVEGIVGRGITNAEAARFAAAVPRSSIPEAVLAVLDACDIYEDEEG